MQEYSKTTQSSGYSDDALTAVIGPEHGGRVRGLGFGVTMRTLNLRNSASQKYERTINELKQEMNEKFQRQEERQDQMMQLIQSLVINAFKFVTISV